jgi:hypothetical protein
MRDIAWRAAEAWLRPKIRLHAVAGLHADAVLHVGADLASVAGLCLVAGLRFARSPVRRAGRCDQAARRVDGRRRQDPVGIVDVDVIGRTSGVPPGSAVGSGPARGELAWRELALAVRALRVLVLGKLAGTELGGAELTGAELSGAELGRRNWSCGELRLGELALRRELAGNWRAWLCHASREVGRQRARLRLAVRPAARLVWPAGRSLSLARRAGVARRPWITGRAWITSRACILAGLRRGVLGRRSASPWPAGLRRIRGTGAGAWVDAWA